MFTGPINVSTLIVASYLSPVVFLTILRIAVPNVDGVKQNLVSRASSGNIQASVDDPENFRIGTLWDNESQFFEGVIDEFRFYRKLLSEDEVKINFAAQGFAVEAAGKLAATWGEIRVSR